MPEAMNAVKNDIGYLSQKFSLYTDLTVDENIEFIADIHNLKKFKERRDELLGFTRLTAFRNFTAGKLSGGMKQKLALACTLIYRPKIIFLDEPTTGVDPVSRREFWIILSNLLKENITIIISTPYMDEAERFSRIALLNNGNLLCVDTPGKIKAMMNYDIVSVTSSQIRKANAILRKNMPYEIQMFGDRLNIISKHQVDIPEIEALLASENVDVTEVRRIQPTLENAFIHLIEED